jgi:hypothetical protein
MKVASRAAFLSGLVLPGMGQYYNHERLKGVVIMTVTVLLVGGMGWRIYSLIYHAFMVPEVLDRLPYSVTPQLIERLHRQAYAQNWWLLALIVVLWLYSIVDAYYQARKGGPPPVQ